MQLKPVTSSKLARVGYDEENQILFVQFPDGKMPVYAYSEVDPLLFDEMMEAESLGKFFIANIQGKRNEPIKPFKKIGDGSVLDADGNLIETPASVLPSASPQRGLPLPAAPDIAQLQPKGEVIPPTVTIPELPAKDEELRPRALSVESEARALKIVSAAAYSAAEALLLRVKAEGKLVLERLQRVYDPAYRAYVEARTLRDEAVAPYKVAEETLKRTMLGYIEAERRQRQEAEAAERRRLEERAKADAEKQAAEDAERAAQTFEAQGEIELAQSARANPLPVAVAPVAPVVLESQVPKGRSSVRANWQWRQKAGEAVPLDHRYYSLDEKKINALVKALGEHASIPGIEVYDAGTLSVRTR